MRLLAAVDVPCAVLLFGLAGCGHDARRENPLDPVLTPPVALQVTADVASRTVSLAWTPYDGSQELVEYRVLRNVAGRVRVDTVAILDPDRLAYADSGLAPGTYNYRVAAVNAAGYEGVSLPGTAILGNRLPGSWSVSFVQWEGTTLEATVRLELVLREDGNLILESTHDDVAGFFSERYHNEGTWATNGSLLTLNFHDGLYEPVFLGDGVLRFCKRDRWDSPLFGDFRFTGDGERLVDTVWTKNISGQTLVFRSDQTWELTASDGGRADGGTWQWRDGLVTIRRSVTSPYAIVGSKLYFTNPLSSESLLLPLNRGSEGTVLVEGSQDANSWCQ